MWLYFDSTGALIEALQHGPAARAGTTDFQIFAYFEGVDTIANGSATVKLVKPDLYDSSYPPLGMSKVNMKYQALNGENSEHFSVNGGPNGDGYYPGFLFDFSNFSGDQDVAILLDTPGLWRAIISLYGQNHISVQGTSTFNVQYGSITDEGTELAWEELVNSIFRIINTKLNIVNGIPVASSTESIDLTEYEVGQVFYIINAGKTTNKLVRVVLGAGDEKEFDTLFDFTAYYTKDEIDAKVLDLNEAISEEARLRSAADDALSDRINEKSTVSGTVVNNKWKTLTIDGETHNLGGDGGASYEAGTGIVIDYSTTDTISVDTDVIASKDFVSDTYLSKSDASSIYETQSHASETYETISHASSTYIPKTYATDQASPLNPLVDRNFVNSSIATNTAYFIGTFENVETLLGINKLTVGSVLKADSVLKIGSIVNNETVVNQDYILDSDLTITSLSTLAMGSLIKSGSSINTGSWIDHISYDGPTTTVSDITIEEWTNNDYAFVMNSERDFVSTTEMNAYPKNLLTEFDYGWVPNGSKFDLYRFDIVTQTWNLRVSNTNKADVTLNSAYNRYKYNSDDAEWSYEYTLNNSSFTANQWAAINSGITADLLSQLARQNIIAPDYSNSATYSVGDKVIYNNKLYKCTTAITQAEDFDATHWTEITVSSGFVDLDSEQTITGEKTFRTLKLQNEGSNHYATISMDALTTVCSFNQNDSLAFRYDNGSVTMNRTTRPMLNNHYDLGTSSLKWRDLYLSGKIKDGTNEASLAELLAGNINTINASDIVNNTLTQAQYDLITNGKPTRIVGTLLGYPNMIIFAVNLYNSANDVGICFINNTSSYQRVKIKNIFIDRFNKTLSLSSFGGTFYALEFDDIGFFNKKELPAYPSDTTKQYKFVQKVGGNLDYVEDYAQPYATNSTTELKYETINNISVSADTTYSLATAPTGTYPEYKANITNSGANAINLTFTNVSVIKTNDSNITIASNVLTLPAGTTIEVNIQNGKMIAFNWSAN